MNHQFISQFHKEHLEALRKKRLLILAILFIAAGMMSPLIAKLTPELMKAALPHTTQITFPEPSSVDAWGQFFKNISQFGLLALVLLYGDTLAGEIERGTLLSLLPLGLKRRNVVLGKAAYLGVTWTGGYWLSFAICFGYTRYFFTDDLSRNLASAVIPLWLYGLLLCAFLILASAVGNNGLQSLFYFALMFAASLVINLFQKINHYNPFSLGSENAKWLTGASDFTDSLPAVILAVTLLLLSIWCALKIFTKRLL